MQMLRKIKLLGDNIKLTGDKSDTYFTDYCKEGYEFEDLVISVCNKYIDSNNIVMDIGANIGITSLALSKIAKDGKVYSFEPSPRIYPYLVENIKANNSHNIHPFMLAVGNSNSKIKFNHALTFAAGSFISESEIDPTAFNTTCFDVDCKTLDSIAEDLQLNRIDFIKLDVEGFELEVLRGAKKTIEKFKPFWIIEFNSWTLIAFQENLPQKALREILSIFPFVYHIDRLNGNLKLLSSEIEMMQFLHLNVTQGCVDNLLCSHTGEPNIVGNIYTPKKSFIKKLKSKLKAIVRRFIE